MSISPCGKWKHHTFRVPVNTLIVRKKDPLPGFKIEGKNYELKMVLSPFQYIITDGKADYSLVQVPDNIMAQYKAGLMNCRDLCRRKRLRRKHRYCLRCPLKMTLDGKMKPLQRVQLFMFVRREERPGAAWKNRVMKRLMIPVEELAWH